MTTFTTNSTDVLQLLNNITDPKKIETIKEMYITFTLKDNIIPSISRFTSLMYLNISMNKIKNISNEIVELKNLKVFRADYNIITCIPYYFFELTELTELYLKCNKIKTLPIKIKKLTNLEVLNINSNDIRKIPIEIGNLTKLICLELSANKITNIPSEIGNLTKITYLNLGHNNIDKIPLQIKNLKNLSNFYMNSCKVFNIPDELCNLTNLQILQLSGNIIVTVPNNIGKLINLKGLYLDCNYVKKIPNEIENLINLEYLYINYNNISEFPINVINLRRLREFKFLNNLFDFIPLQVHRFIRLMTINYNNLPLYNDDQNIHDTTIQKSIKNSIINITSKKIEINEDQIISQILDDSILTSKTKKILIEYSNDNDFHSVLLITFKELLMFVWISIEENEYKDDIKEILNTEILDAQCKCFTGRLSRLINCLNGFSDLVEIKIADSQQIGIIIILIKNDLLLKQEYTIEKHKKLVKEELQKRSYDETIIEEWIEQIE